MATFENRSEQTDVAAAGGRLAESLGRPRLDGAPVEESQYETGKGCLVMSILLVIAIAAAIVLAVAFGDFH